MIAQAQSELQHVETLLIMTPFGELIEPGAFKLRPAQTLGIFGGETLRSGAIGPLQPPPRGLPQGTLTAMDGEEARDALNHDIAHIRHGLANKRDAANRLLREARKPQRKAAHPLGARARLARAASAHYDPLHPRAAIARAQWGELVIARVQLPKTAKRRNFSRAECRQRLFQQRIILR